MTIICNIQMFDLHQKIYLLDENGEQKEIGTAVALNQLPEKIIELCSAYKIHNVHLFGMDAYAKATANQIQSYNQNSFNYFINIEVN